MKGASQSGGDTAGARATSRNWLMIDGGRVRKKLESLMALAVR